jgi:hypothetical protein
MEPVCAVCIEPAIQDSIDYRMIEVDGEAVHAQCALDEGLVTLKDLGRA